MSGRHRRPEADPLSDVDVAERISSGPVVPVASDPVVAAASEPATPVDSHVVTRGRRTAGDTTVPGGRRARAAVRAERRADRRRRMLIIGAAIVTLAVLVTVGVALVTRGQDDNGPTTATTTTAKQRTLLVQVTGAGGAAAASALVGVTPRDDSASVVLVPSGVLVDVAGTGNIPFGETTTLDESSAPANALTDLVGVRIDDTWTLTTGGLAALVDAVKGVRVAVDSDVIRTAANGDETVVVSAGNQQLDGDPAAAFATYLAEGEPEQVRLARFDDVFAAAVKALPADPAKARSLVEGLGDGSQSTLDAAGLASRLLALRAASSATGSLVSDVLPVTEIDSGGTTPTYGIDSGQLAATMRARFPGALQGGPGGDALRVLVENGVGTPGLVDKARTRLVDAGFRFINGGNAATFTKTPSTVFIPDGTDKSVKRGEQVATALGLPETSIATSDRQQTVADVIVILGSDFRP